MASSSSNVVGVHYRVGKKIGEGSFGVIFEGMNLLNSQQVAIKFVRLCNTTPRHKVSRNETRLTFGLLALHCRNPGRVTRLSCATSTGRTRSWWAAVSLFSGRDCRDMQSNHASLFQLAFPMSTTSAKKACTTSWSLTCSARRWKISSTTATGGSALRQSAW